MRIDILCATDDNFAEQCGVMLASLFSKNAMHEIHVHVFEERLSEDVKNKLLKFTKQFKQTISFYRITEASLNGCEIQKGSVVSMAAYYRFLVAKIIVDITIKRILYLDCDIVVNDDLACLFKMNMREFPIAAVRDICKPLNEEHMYDITMSYDSRYFNSGMMLINLDMWRQNNYESELLNEAQEIKSLKFPDQDPLNVVFRNKWLELKPSWNRFHFVRYHDVYFCTKHDMLEYISNPKIIHYANPICRPWQDISFVPFRKIYEKYKAMTPWKNNPRVKVEKKSRYKEIIRQRIANFVYRSPLLLKYPLVLCFDLLLFIYHITRFQSLSGYSNCKNIIRL